MPENSSTVKIDGGLRPKPPGAYTRSGNLQRLLDSLGVKMQKRRIDIRIESGLDELWLSYAIPTFVANENLHRGMRCQFELFLNLS